MVSSDSILSGRALSCQLSKEAKADWKLYSENAMLCSARRLETKAKEEIQRLGGQWVDHRDTWQPETD